MYAFGKIASPAVIHVWGECREPRASIEISQLVPGGSTTLNSRCHKTLAAGNQRAV